MMNANVLKLFMIYCIIFMLLQVVSACDDDSSSSSSPASSSKESKEPEVSPTDQPNDESNEVGENTDIDTNNEENIDDEELTEDDAPTDSNDIDSADVSSYGGIVTGQLSLGSGVPDTALNKAALTAIGRPEIVGETYEDGSFKMINVPPGTLQIVVSSGSGLSLSGPSPASYGVIIPDVVVSPGKVTEVGESILEKTGSITGVVDVFNGSIEKSGTDVYIPGTSYVGKTDEQGRFTLSGIPKGDFDVFVQRDGYAIAKVRDVSVLSDEITQIGTIKLSLSDGPEGTISLLGGSTVMINDSQRAYITSRSVTLSLDYDSDATLMKVSDEPSFLNKSWTPVTDSYEWTFNSDGDKSVYVMYSDPNGLESSPYSTSFYVDTEAPSLESIELLYGWAQTASEHVFATTVASDSGTGIKEIIFSNVDDQFDHDEAYQEYSAKLNVELGSGAGNKTIYAKVRDYAGNESTVLSDEIVLGTDTLIYVKEYSELITLSKAQSPFVLENNTHFDGGLLVEAGVSLEINSNLNVKGVFTAVGTASDPIIFEGPSWASNYDCSMGGSPYEMNLHQGAPGVSLHNRIQYAKISGNLRVNGGLVSNNEFSSECQPSTGQGGSITKTGLDSLILRNNTFEEWKKVMDMQGGSSNVTVENNSGTVYEFISQTGDGSGIVVKGNTIEYLQDSWGNGGSAITLNNDDFVWENNTLSGTPSRLLSFWVVDSNPADIDLSFLPFTNVKTAVSVTGNDGNVTVRNINVTSGCETGISVNQISNTVVTIINANIINCESGTYKAPIMLYGRSDGDASVLNIQNSTLSGTLGAWLYQKGVVNISNSTITAREALFNASGAPMNLSVSDSNLECSPDSGICDLVFVQYYPTDAKLVLDWSQNNITCQGDASSGCRGFTSKVPYSSQRSYELDLSLDDNYWIGKPLANGGDWASMYSGNESTCSNVSNISTTAATNVELFRFCASGGDYLRFDTSSVALPSSITSAGSAFAGTGDPD